MKLSMKLMAIVGLLFTFTFSAQAQRGGGDGERLTPEQRAERQTERLVEKLDLTDAQTAKVGAIHLKYAEKMKAAHEAGDREDREAMREVRTAIKEEQNAEMKLILTAEQFATYEEMAARPKRGKGKRKGKKGGERDGQR